MRAVSLILQGLLCRVIKASGSYIDIGTYAGNAASEWGRRLKVPLRDIAPGAIEKVMEDSKLVLETRVPGTGRDGGPNCATVKPFDGWGVEKR